MITNNITFQEFNNKPKNRKIMSAFSKKEGWITCCVYARINLTSMGGVTNKKKKKSPQYLRLIATLSNPVSV